MPVEPIRTELSDNPEDYLTGPTSGDNPTEGGTTKDGAVALFRSTTAVRPVDDGQQSSGGS